MRMMFFLKKKMLIARPIKLARIKSTYAMMPYKIAFFVLWMVSSACKNELKACYLVYSRVAIRIYY